LAHCTISVQGHQFDSSGSRTFSLRRSGISIVGYFIHMRAYILMVGSSVHRNETSTSYSIPCGYFGMIEPSLFTSSCSLYNKVPFLYRTHSYQNAARSFVPGRFDVGSNYSSDSPSDSPSDSLTNNQLSCRVTLPGQLSHLPTSSPSSDSPSDSP
jgi:hypothetical protein